MLKVVRNSLTTKVPWAVAKDVEEYISDPEETRIVEELSNTTWRLFFVNGEYLSSLHPEVYRSFVKDRFLSEVWFEFGAAPSGGKTSTSAEPATMELRVTTSAIGRPTMQEVVSLRPYYYGVGCFDGLRGKTRSFLRHPAVDDAEYVISMMGLLLGVKVRFPGLLGNKHFWPYRSTWVQAAEPLPLMSNDTALPAR